MFATNNRVKRRPSPYEMEITDGEFTPTPNLCTQSLKLLEPLKAGPSGTTPRCLTGMGELSWSP